MTDISNNFSNFDKGNNYNKEVIPKEEVPSKIEDKQGTVPVYETLPAADVLGRSQVPSSPKGSDVTGSVNEAVAVAEKFADTLSDINIISGSLALSASKKSFSCETISTWEQWLWAIIFLYLLEISNLLSKIKI